MKIAFKIIFTVLIISLLFIGGQKPVKHNQGNLTSKSEVINANLLNSKDVELKGTVKPPTKINYFRGSDRAKWTKDTPIFDQVETGEVYDGKLVLI